MAQNASESVEAITKALQRYNNALNSVNNSSKGLSSAVDSFKETVESASSALISSDYSFTKWTKSVDSSTKFLKTTTTFATNGLPKTRLTINGLLEAGRLLVNAVLESNDAQLNNYDAVAKLGIGIGTSAEGLTSMANEAGFWSSNTGGLIKGYEILGSGLTNLGETSNAGAKEFGKIVKTGDGVVSEFMRLGVSQSDLVALQADYVSMTQMLGSKYVRNDEKLKDESRSYVTSLVALSRITGTSIQDLSAQRAEQARDIQFAIRLRTLRKTEHGRLLADKYSEAELIAQNFLGPEVAKGVRDFLASGTATTKEGEALLVKTNGQITQWKADLDAGRIDQQEFMKKIAESSQQYEEKNRTALMQSKDFRDKTATSVQAMNGQDRLIKSQSLAAVRAEMEAYKKGEKAGEKVDDKLKEAQIAAFEVAQRTGIAKDKLIAIIQEPVNGALRTLADSVKQAAIGTIRLGAWLLGLDSSKIDDALVALGDTTQIKSYIESLNKSIKETDTQIQVQKTFADAQKDNEKKLQDAIKRKKELEGKISQAGTEQERTKLAGELTSANLDVKTYEVSRETLKKDEKEKFGQTSDELQKKREDLIKRKKVAEGKKTESEKDEGKKSDVYRSYVDGKGTEYDRWTKIDPNFQEKVIAMAQKYFGITGKKLHITSSYRSEEEQKDMYNEWRKAGGRYPWEKNPNPKVWTEKYGWLYMPSESPGGHGSGTAVDINRDQLDWLEQNGYLDEFGLRRHYPIEQDPVHVVPKAKNGGVFEGMVELHGKEAISPMVGNSIPIDLIQSGSMKDFKQTTGTITRPKIYTPPSQQVNSKPNEFVEVLLAKIDDLNRKISESNSIYSDIKLYMSN